MVQPTALFPEVEPLRAASRQVVRELGMLDDRGLPARISHSQCHALIELDRAGGEGLGVAELATRLNLDKSTMSRTVSRLVRSGLLTHGSGPDKRKKPLRLTAEGRLSAIILGSLPLLFGIYLVLVKPKYVQPMLTDPLGWLMLSLAGVLLAVGAFWISRVVRIEV